MDHFSTWNLVNGQIAANYGEAKKRKNLVRHWEGGGVIGRRSNGGGADTAQQERIIKFADRDRYNLKNVALNSRLGRPWKNFPPKIKLKTSLQKCSQRAPLISTFIQ